MAHPLPVATEVPARQIFSLSSISNLNSGEGRSSLGLFSTGINSPVKEACVTVKASDEKTTQSPGKTSPPKRNPIISMEQNKITQQVIRTSQNQHIPRNDLFTIELDLFVGTKESDASRDGIEQLRCLRERFR